MSDTKQTKLTQAEQDHLKEHFPGGAYKFSGKVKENITTKPQGSWKPSK